jgi:hypothetical protein
MQIVRYAFVLAVAALALPRHASADAGCPDGSTVWQHVEWCSRDGGYNEGAQCGLDALGGSLLGLPSGLTGDILANAWPRRDMIGAARIAYHRANAKSAGINAVVCCQVHNPPVYACLSNNRGAISDWLAARSADARELEAPSSRALGTSGASAMESSR